MSAPRPTIRWVLHPVAPALALVVGCVGAAVAGTAALLALVAGCAAGFANSGST